MKYPRKMKCPNINCQKELEIKIEAELYQCPYCYYKFMKEKLNSCKHQWIKCSDRLPEIGKDVLAIIHGEIKKVFLDQATAGVEWVLCDADCHYEICDSTHWMPLPEPPENKVPKFTPQQIDYVCYMIGEWYLIWKHKIVDQGTLHRLGYAKEELKEMLFPIEENQE